MPNCKNDPTRKYKGTEPSPKGLGYCAHSMKVGAVKKGKDRNKWEIRKVKNGSKRWMKVKVNKEKIKKKNMKNMKNENMKNENMKNENMKNKNMKNENMKNENVQKIKMVVFSKEKLGGTFIHGVNKFIIKVGKIDNNKFYEWISYNKFHTETNMPTGYKEYEIPNKNINTYFYGNNEKNMKKLTKLSKHKHYYILDTGYSFVVFINKNNVTIFRINDDNDFLLDWGYEIFKKKKYYLFTKFVKEYNTKKIFIGKSPLIEMTKFSGGHGKKFDGNSILLNISNNKYIYIGGIIYEFKSYSTIIKFVSPVGNSNVSYPYAVDDKNNTYLFLENLCINNKTHKTKFNIIKNYDDPYNYYYDLHSITTNNAYITPKTQIIKNFENIDTFYIKNNKYTLTHVINPKDNYKRLIKSFGKPLYIKYKTGKKTILTEKKYINIMKNFSKLINCKKIKNIKIIDDKIYKHKRI